MTAATAQQVGIVEIDTVLRYQGARAAGTGMVLTTDGETPSRSATPAPLYGDDGKVIGMDTAASSGGPADAYAIPIGTATALAPQIESGANDATIHHGSPGFLGVSVTDGADGATVARVLSGGAAEKAGPTAGDVITSMGGTAISSPGDLGSTLQRHRPGDRVRVALTNPDGTTDSATVTLGTGPAD